MLLAIDVGNTNTIFAVHDGSAFIGEWRCAVVFNLRLLCNSYFSCRPIVVGKPDCDLPVGVRVDNGTIVGADRLVNTVGAYHRHGGDLIVVDFGTATTFDVVAEDGAYIGGVIAPGVNLSLKALHCTQIRTEYKRAMKVVGTGGLSTLFDQGTEIFDALEADLTLQGLLLIHEHNVKAER